MGVWIYVITAGDILQKQARLSFSSAGVLTATLENPSQTTTSASTTALSAFSGWSYLSFTITYVTGSTTITAYKNGAAGTALSNTAYLYRDAASDVLYLGKSSTSSTFVGFIYYFSLWNTAITDFSSKFTIPCGTSLTTSCLWSCPIGQYYATSSCTSCNSCGSMGCRRAISCNICADPLCAQCTGFGTNLCTLCVTHASGGGATPCSCDTNYIASADGFSCIWACTTGCAGCSGTGYYQCTSCLASYYYLNGLCLASCPAGYNQDSTNNLCTLSSTTPVSLALQDLIQLDTANSFTVGSSSSNTYPSWTDSADPVPSIFRGYYFGSSSLMSLSSLIITPFYTVTIWVKPSAQGNLFLKLSGSTEMLKIVFTSSGWPSITLTLQDSSTVTLSGSLSLFNAWHNIAFTGDIISGNTKILFYTDGSLISSQLSANISPFRDSGSLYIGFSNGANGFTGFLWSLKIFNGNTHYSDEWIISGCASGCSTCPSELLCPDSCSFGSFLSSGACTTCTGSCSPYGCRSTETCRLCKYRECTTCTLFDGPCTACITNASLSGGVCSCNSNAFWVASSATCELCDALCSTCTGTYYFLCSVCSGSTVLVGNVCLNACPYGFSASPSCTAISTTVIDQSFDTNFSGTYGIFTTSTSASTYQFWNGPDSLDPIPAYKRGLYFAGGQYLVSNTNIYLSNNVSVGVWIYVITAGDILQKQARLSFSSAGVLTATLENPSQTTAIVSTTALSAFSGWTYLSFTIIYTSGSTTITAYKDGAAGTTLSSAAYLYRDAASDFLYLGKSSSSSTFAGFIYYFSLWNAAITDFSSSFTIPCSTSLDISCLWSCPIGQYYATSSCTSCNSCGSMGCRRAVSCNICADPLCAQCTGFGTGLCTLCVAHASGGGATPCSCDTNYIVSADGFSCVWACTTGCAGCSGTGYYQCTSCLASYYYLNGLCLASCPAGYNQDSTNNLCTLSSTTPVSLALQDLIQLDTANSFTVGSSSSNTYPSWTDSADPVPSIFRGYYFGSSSLMSLSSLIITPFYTVTIWVKPSAQGNLFLKLNGSTEMFKIVFTSSGWPSITLTLQDSSTVTLSGSLSLFNAWHNIAFTGDIVSGKSKIYFYADGSLISNQVSTNVSPFIDAGSLYLGYANGANSFIGFLWSVKLFNGNTHFLDEWQTSGCSGPCSNCPSELICPDSCEFGSFYSSGSCITCAGSCSPYGCRSSLTCRLCQNKECTTCTLFDGPCTACITNAGLSGGVCSCNSNAFWIQSSETCEICDNLCSTCLKTYYFECNDCTGTKVLVDTVCLNECPYSFTASLSCISSTSTIIDQSFDTIFQGSYGILTTSTSASTYQFFTNPDSSDPVPSYGRGLYFSGSQYLQANVNIYMNYQFSVGFWIYTIADGDIFQKQARVKLASNGIANIILENPSQTTTTVTTSSLTFSGWSYLSLTVSYLSGSTTTVTSVNNVAETPILSTNLLFRDVSSDILYVGKSTSSGFEGFIYYFSLWYTAISDFSSKLSVPCGSSLSTSCLWSCDISDYYDGAACQSCNSCSLGCTQGVSCNICYDHLCSICSGFGSGLCTQCVNHASGGGATACSCDANYIQAADGFSCIWGCTTGCGGCSGTSYYQCTSCLTMYYFISGLCISVCPTGYTQDSTNNQCTLVSNLSFSLQFQDLIQLDTVSGVQVGSSGTNTYPTFESTDPVPSLYRGYYFISNSYMASTSLILNTYFTVTVWIKPISSGYLMLKINGSDEMFNISFSSGGVPTLMITLQDLSTVSVSGASNLFNGWHNIAFTSDIISGKMKIYLYTDGVVSASQLSTNSSPFIDLGNLKIGASSGTNGFTGFLWSLKVFNSNSNYLDEWKTTGCVGGCSSCPSELKCPDNCDFGSFYSSGCTTCDSSCSPYGCRSSLTCRLCLQKECKECTLFDGPCTSCIDRATLTSGVCACDSNAFWVQSSQTCEYCDSLCTQCAGTYYFLCSACTTGETLVGNVCLHECPYGFGGSCTSVSSQVITQSFDQNFAGSYGIFTTATSSSTYQFFNSPEASDPIPAKKRGLYFSSGKYLESNIDVYLSYSFSLGFWAYVETAGDLFEKQNRLIINSSGAATIILESPSLITTTITTGVISSSGWSYYSIAISYSSGSTTATVYINNAAGTPSSTSNYIFRDAASQTILIGKSTASSFSGFIYNFNMWNSLITDFSTQVNDDICGTGLGSTCLWTCDFGSYQNSGGTCSACNSCSLGCVRGVSCNVCDDKLCSVCTGFGTNLCTTCVIHASGSVCLCDIGYYLSSDGFSCVVCSTGCSACTGLNYYQCSSCMSSYYYINNLCEPSCPTGYTQNSTTHNCDLYSSLALYLNLIDQLRLDTVSGFTVGSDSTNTYPSWDAYDPIPAIQRGYYFTGSSYMISNFKFSPYFSLSSWVKGLNDGYFLTKYDGSVYLSISFTAGVPTLTIKLLDGTTISVSGGSSSIFNSWNFFSFSGQILGDGTTKITSYINGASVGTQISGTSSLFRDSASGSLILGADQTLANGWSGYIWNLQVYNDDSHAIADWATSGCGSGCSQCPASLTCLSDCSLSTYPTSCTPCKTGCSHGCVGGLTCRLCKAKECLSCNTFSGACLSCIPNASLSGTVCQCNANALWVNSSESCEICNNVCDSCLSLTFVGCITCSSGRYLLENLCIKYCPTGYSMSVNKCLIASSDAYVFNFKPNQIKDEVIDLQSSIVVSTGNDTNFYPNYQERDPYAAQYRGYFFTGKSYMNLTLSSRPLIFSPKFTISIWLNPAATSCDLFAKQSNSTSAMPILKLSLSSLSPSLKIRLNDGSTALYTSANSLSQNQWNLLIVSSGISATPAQIISFSVNAGQDISSDLASSWFEDLQDSFKITIGSSLLSSSAFGNYFSGFIWDLKIWNKAVDFSSLYSLTCSQCSLCPIDNSGACIPNCPISEYWDGMKCSSCTNECLSLGCVRYDNTCNLCNNVICSVCNDFIAGSCLRCKANAYLASGECICNNGYYLNRTMEECLQCDINQYSVNGICKSCSSKCTSCLDSLICYTCIDTAELSQNNSCICKIGHNGTNCDAAYFDAFLAVNDDNSLNLTFSENLVNIISQYDLSISVENTSLSDYSWTIEKVSSKFYSISLSFSIEVSSKTPIVVKLLNLTYFVSEANALLKDDTLIGALYYYNPYSSSQAVSAVTSQTTAAVQSIIGSSVAVSFINPNPASLWSMMNILNYIAYLGLTKIPMTDSFYAFVTSMNGSYYLPNLFEYFIDKSQGTAPYTQAIKYGYDTDLFLINVGSAITALGAIVASLPVVYFLSNCSQRYLAKKLAGILKNYKWSVFVRFWIQSYLDFTAAALIGLLNFSFGNMTQATNTIICLVVFSFASVSPLLFFMLSYKNLPKIQEREKGFEKLWSSFFYEFKNDQGLMSTQYYSLFFGRRFIYIMNLALLNDYPASQVTISTVLSFITVLYLIRYRPYEEPILQITNTLSEICTMIFMGLMSASLFDLSSSMQSDFELTLISVAIAIMGILTVSSIALFGKTCYELVKEGLQKSPPPQNKYQVRVNRKENMRVVDLNSNPTEINRSMVNNELPDIGDGVID
ncbi:unnamed protein product [Blepharisma stoltei]|uniref:TNFR-Cys domain-containing protein n=1 Tax=Blepharisma stoltei TaxID=1481888 RepID=A0AAU9IL22_9CILI|nr:unnamed protein product [Blepharisma stoltei]